MAGSHASRKLMSPLTSMAAIVLTLTLGAPVPVPAVELQGGTPAGGQKRAGLAFLDSELNRLARAGTDVVAAAKADGAAPGRTSGDARIKVSFIFRDGASAAGALAALPALGAEVTAHYGRLVDASVPVVSLADLGSLPGLIIAHRPFSPFQAGQGVAMPAAAAGVVLSEGVAASGADAWHGAGIDGLGVTVGIVDSFAGYDGAAVAGEVPAAAAVGTLDTTDAQGTSSAEVIHDMAPGATVLRASATTTTEAAERIAQLALAGARVIASSRSYVSPDAPPLVGPGREPGDGSSALCQAIADARDAHGVVFVQAAGDHALSHWDGAFADTNRDFFHEFAPGVEVNRILLGTTAAATFLRWDDWPESTQDFDLELVVMNGQGGWDLVVSSQNVQSGTQPPWEYVQATLDPLKQYGIRIKKYGATRNVFLDLMDFGRARLEYTVPERSLVDAAACAGALSVGALDAQDLAFPLADASSQGPTYGPGGTSADGLDQPRIAAYAGVDTLTNGDDGFGGTAAAVPHVAGALALVMQQHPLMTPDQAQAFLELRSIDVVNTPAGYDHESGAGRLALGEPGVCAFELAPAQAEVSPDGGEGAFEVTTAAGCPWTAVSSDDWLAVTAGAVGTGNGSVAYQAAANDGEARSATIAVGSATFTVDQESAACSYELAATSAAIAAAGGEASVGVSTNLSGCEWTAVANDPWITVTGGAAGAGDGTVAYAVAVNEGEARSGTITIAGQTFTVEQARAECVFTLDPTTAAFAAAGGDGSVAVGASLVSCEWTAVSNAEWITLTGDTGGSGDGAVLYSVAANEGEARSGTVTIAGLTFTVEQSAAPCTYGLSASGTTVPAAGGDGGVVVTTNLDSCAWTAVSNVPWITVTGGAAETGSGTVTFSAAANDGEARSGTLTVAGHEFTVDQAEAPCAFELSAPGASLPAVGGPGSVDVGSNRASCGWTAVSNAAWITVMGGAAGTGDGTVSFSVAANAGDARSGTITIAGLTFTVDQAAVPCELTLASLSAGFAAAGGNGGVGVIANIQTCSWTAASNAAWITVTGGASGTGDGAVSFLVAANAGAARTGTLTIAGLTFTVLQGEAGCLYSLYSWSASFFPEGGPGQTRVYSIPSTCTWNAISNAPAWLTITAGQAGSDSEVVTYEVAANPGLARQGTLTVAGHSYTVYQQGAPCTFALTASGAELGAEGGVGSVDVTSSSAACPWTAVSSAPEWLSVTAGAAGAGDGTVSFAVGVNAGDVRIATLTIGGQTFTVQQASPPCTYGIAPTEEAFAAAGGSGAVTVTTAFASCAWTAASDAPEWLTIAAGAAGVGAGIVEFAVADNPGEPRSGTLTVAGQVFTVSQEKHGVQLRRTVKRKP